MDFKRRTVLQAAAATLPAAALPAGASTPAAPALGAVPSIPATPSPGKPGDFDFLAGEWRIDNWRKRSAEAPWERFEGEATCWTILAGVGSVEELRIPARNFSGMGLRLLDVERRAWSDFWVNAKSGVLTSPGQGGSFEQGVGLFWSEYEEQGRKMISAGIWDQIAPNACRWRQVVSGDAGATWDHNWVMHWRRK